MLVAVKEELQTQLRIVFNKLTGLENKLHESPQEVNHSKCQAMPSFDQAPHPQDPECKPPDSKTSRKKSNYEIVTVFEKVVTNEQRKRAQLLELPDNFFAYEDSLPETSLCEPATVDR